MEVTETSLENTFPFQFLLFGGRNTKESEAKASLRAQKSNCIEAKEPQCGSQHHRLSLWATKVVDEDFIEWHYAKLLREIVVFLVSPNALDLSTQ